MRLSSRSAGRSAAARRPRAARRRPRAGLLLLLLAFAAGVVLQRAGALAFLDGWRAIAPLAAWRARLALERADPPRVGLEIGRNAYLELDRQRDEALRRGHIGATNEDAVPARVRFDGEVLDADVRLKGDYPDHVAGDKWSLRVDVKDGSVLGVRRFSLMSPHVRRGVHEWLFHRILRHEGLLALRYEFVGVDLNGSDKGVYALEEHFDGPLAENAGLREGLFLRFSEAIAWSDWEADQFSIDDDRAYVDPYFAADVDAFRTGRVLADPELRAQYLRAARAMDAFRRGTVTAGTVFDARKMGRLYALGDLLGAQHAIAWYNMRFYWDPMTARLEPVGFDALPGQVIHDLSYMDARSDDKNGYWFYKVMQARMFADPTVTAAYVAELERLSADGYLESLLDLFADELDANVALLRAEDPEATFDTEGYLTNRVLIRHYLAPPDPRLHAWSQRTGPREETLWLGSSHRLPIEVVGVFRSGVELVPDREITVQPPKHRSRPVVYETYRFALADADDAPLEVRFRLLGSTRVASVLAAPAEGTALVDAPDPPLEWTPNADELAFVHRNESTGWLEIEPGVHELARTLVVPAGSRLVGFAGTELRLAPGTLILSRSPLEIVASAEAPFVVRAPDGRAGLVVLRAGDASRLEHVTFDGLAAPTAGDWSLTGAVTFYESPLALRHVLFTRCDAEDALNVVRTSYTIEDTTVERCTSDGLDADASTGTLRRCVFLECGGDAVDISLGELDASQVRVEDVADKAFSIGERSTARLDACTLARVGIAIASKDGSYTTVRDTRIVGAGIALAAYRKKPEYGPAGLRAEGVTIAEARRVRLLEQGSWLLVDGEPSTPLAPDEVARALAEVGPP